MLASTMTVLVVDDEPGILMLAEGWLMEMGFLQENILTAENAMGAQNIIRRKHLDLLVTDGNMPGGNGIQLMELARGLNPEIKLLLMSGSLQENLSLYSGTVAILGDFGKLQKPFGEERFVAAIKKEGIESPDTEASPILAV